MPRVIIEVTGELIHIGKRAGCDDCPVALGIAEVVRADVEVHVMHKNVRLMEFDKKQTIRLRQIARDFITKFDYHATGEPFSFPLDIRVEFLRGEG